MSVSTSLKTSEINVKKMFDRCLDGVLFSIYQKTGLEVMVEINQFKAARDKAMSELRVSIIRRKNLHAELAKYNVRIEELRKGVEGLNALCGDDGGADPDLLIEISSLNLADAVRAVLAASELHLTPMDIRYKLKRLGYKVEDYTNALASIHSILKRLEESGLADTINKDGKTAYLLLKTEG